MTASPMPQATALAETPPLAQQPGRKARDTLYLAEGLASRIHDIRNVVAAIDHIQQDRITGYADATCDPELQNACDQIASMHVMVVETLERTERLADELTDALRPLTAFGAASWAAAIAGMSAAEAADRLSDRSDATSDALAAAQTRVMDTPAPDIAALRWKLDHILQDDDGSINPWSTSYVEQTKRDIARLLGEA